MRQDLLATLHRAARALAPPLRSLRPVLRPVQKLGRRAFDHLVSIRYPNGTLMVAFQNGRQWRLEPEVALRGPDQEFETVLIFREFVQPGMNVIDVGANVGQMTLELATLVGPSGRVLSIEPAAGNLRLLHRHLQGNDLDGRVDVIEAACARAHGGSIEFFIVGETVESVGSGHTTWARQHPGLQTYGVQVPRVSIDGLCKERGFVPAFMKIDVEGGEIEVLEGARETLRTARPVVVVGFHPFAFSDAIDASTRLRQLFHELDYRFVGPASGSLDLAEYVAHPVERAPTV